MCCGLYTYLLSLFFINTQLFAFPNKYIKTTRTVSHQKECKKYLFIILMRNILVKGVAAASFQGTGYQDSHDQPIDGDNTRHDNGDDGLHNQLGPHHRHGCDTRA